MKVSGRHDKTLFIYIDPLYALYKLLTCDHFVYNRTGQQFYFTHCSFNILRICARIENVESRHFSVITPNVISDEHQLNLQQTDNAKTFTLSADMGCKNILYKNIYNINNIIILTSMVKFTT